MCDKHRHNFVVFTSARTGSTWLMDLLNNFNQYVKAYGELFYPYPRRSPAKACCNDLYRYIEYNKEIIGKWRPFNIFNYLNILYQQNSTVGFKLMCTQLRKYPEIFIYLKKYNINVIHLVRRNSLDVIISSTIARKTKTSHTTCANNNIGEIKLDTHTIISDIKRLERNIMLRRYLLKLFNFPFIEVEYEKLLSSIDEFNRIVKFLSLSNYNNNNIFNSTIKKRQTKKYADIVLNINEVKSVLSSHGYSLERFGLK